MNDMMHSHTTTFRAVISWFHAAFPGCLFHGCLLAACFLVGPLNARAADCNANGVLDSKDISNRTSFDSNVNGVPDECEGPLIVSCPSRVTQILPPPALNELCCANVEIIPVAYDDQGNRVTATIRNDYNSDRGRFFDCIRAGETVVTFTAQDQQGNVATCATVVEIVDTYPPIILFCPEP